MADRSATVRLRLEVTADAQTVSGRLQDDDGHRLSFWGWLELMEALQQLLSRNGIASQATDTRPHRGRNAGDAH